MIDGIGSDPATVQTEAEAKATGNGDCPKYIGQYSTAARMRGQHASTRSHERGWVYQDESGIKIFGSTSGPPILTYPQASVVKGIVAMDDQAWFVRHCEAKGCGPHGTGVVIDRVIRGTSSATEIVPAQSEIVAAQVLGEHIYWITFGPYGNTGELSRIPREGGSVEVLWRGRGMTVMVLEPDTAFVADDVTVVAVPLGAGKAKPRVLASKLQNVSGLAADNDAIYIAEYGDRYWASDPSGYIKRVPRDGGDVEALAGPLKSPRVVAVDQHRVYYMLSDTGTIWGLIKGTKDAPTMIVPQPPRDAACLQSVWLRADDAGLIWLRRVEGFGKGTLWRLPRKLLPPPPDTAVAAYRRAMEEWAANNGSGSSGGPSGPDDDDP